MKIGILVSFAYLFFYLVLFINTALQKSRKKKEEARKKLANITDEHFLSEKKESEDKLEAEIRDLSDKARKKYLTFRKVFTWADYKKYRMVKIVTASVLGLLFTWFLNIIFGGFVFIVALILVDTIPNFIINKKILKFEKQLVDGLTIVANGLQAGASFPQSVEAMVNEISAPLSDEFGLFLKEVRMGASIEESLQNLSKRVESEELNIAVVSINIARQAGGNLAEILMHISDTIRERERIKGKIDALTSQGKMSGIVIGSLPFLLAIVLNKIDPKLMQPLFTTLIGQIIMLFVLIMITFGFVWIMKIIKIDI
ncbi:MAG: type II secretion system F family protein [Spirochaetes bacterium]|nr:type II secretion system F family protein [Spirochaetota bacterium]